MAYYKRWRKCHAEVRVLADSSSSGSSSNEQDREVQEMGIHSIGNEEAELGLSPDFSHDIDSDYGYSEGVLSSSD